jgi:hypothetical protein
VLAGINPHGGALKTEALPYCGRLRLFGAAIPKLNPMLGRPYSRVNRFAHDDGFRVWHFLEEIAEAAGVRSWGRTGLNADIAETTRLDPPRTSRRSGARKKSELI